ncbi:hypothetical protein SEETLT21_19392, partial [Salmonella enterica subsp. enterica serovar Typhimurium str. LT2-4_delta.ramA::kan]
EGVLSDLADNLRVTITDAKGIVTFVLLDLHQVIAISYQPKTVL